MKRDKLTEELTKILRRLFNQHYSQCLSEQIKRGIAAKKKKLACKVK